MRRGKPTLIANVEDAVALRLRLPRLQGHIEPRQLEKPAREASPNLAGKGPCSKHCAASIIELQEYQSHGH